MFRRDAGFTLLETLAVMVIVGLLAAITVPQASNWREQAHLTSIKTDLKNAANAMEADHDGNVYPAAVPAYFKATSGNSVSLGGGVEPALPANFAKPGVTSSFTTQSVPGGWTIIAGYDPATESPVITMSCGKATRADSTTAKCDDGRGTSDGLRFTVAIACKATGNPGYTVTNKTYFVNNLTVAPSWMPGQTATEVWSPDNWCPQGLSGYSIVSGVAGLYAVVWRNIVPGDGTTFCLNGASTKTTKTFSYSSVTGLKSGAC